MIRESYASLFSLYFIVSINLIWIFDRIAITIILEICQAVIAVIREICLGYSIKYQQKYESLYIWVVLQT